MNNPLDLQSVKFYLEFSDQRIEIAEPVGFEGAKFTLKRDNGRLGRDVEFSSGSSLSFYPNINFRGLSHQFEKIIQAYKSKGFEAEVLFILNVQGINQIIGNLDFKEAKTDVLTYFECDVIQDTTQAKLKRLSGIKIDLFSNEDIHGRPIEPLPKDKILLKSTPTSTLSNWEAVGDYSNTLLSNIEYALSLTPQLLNSEIQNSLTPIYGVRAASDDELEEMIYLEAVNNLTNIKLKLSNFKYDFNGLNNNIVKFIVKIGTEFGSQGDRTIEIPMPNESNGYNHELTLPNINRGERLWMWISVINEGTTNISFDTGNVEVVSISTSISSIALAVRLSDAIKQILKSIGNYTLVSPRFLKGGELYHQFITNGTLIRKVEDKSFKISFEEITKHLPEFYADYEIEDNKNIFFGTYEDFYKDIKLGSFIQAPDQSHKYKVNDLYAINRLELKYKKYEKDNDELRSRESVHTELQLLLPNTQVENTKKIDIEFIRDPFLIEKTRRDAIKVDEDTATSEDQDIFIIDAIEKITQFTESIYLQHIIIEENNVLQLNNDGSFNWTFLGLNEGAIIDLDGQNQGSYIIISIDPQKLLIRDAGFSDPQFSGFEITSFSYVVTETGLTNVTNEDFLSIENTSNPEGYANLNYTPKRNIYKYYLEYLATSCKYKTGDQYEIKVTEFIHNGELKTLRNGDIVSPIIENGPIKTTNLGVGLITPLIVETTVFANFNQFWKLSKDVKKKRGYIEVLDNTDITVKIFITEMDYNWSRNLLMVIGEQMEVNLYNTLPKPIDYMRVGYVSNGYVSNGYVKSELKRIE